MRDFQLQCGAKIRVRYVPSVIVVYETSRRFPQPPKPTTKIEIAKDVFEDREISDAAWLQRMSAYESQQWPIAVKAVRLDLCVELTSPIDQDLLEERTRGLPAHLRFGDKVDYLLYVLLSTTVGRLQNNKPNELDALVAFCTDNDFTYEEAADAGRAIKSDGVVDPVRQS